MILMRNKNYFLNNMMRGAKNATHQGVGATLVGGNRGLRGHPDKCICDTNAYLAIHYKKVSHPSGCLQSVWQDVWQVYKKYRFLQEKVVISYDKNRCKAYPTYPGRS